jgi:hypothetical protein
MSHTSCNYLAFIRACTELAAESAGEAPRDRIASDRVYVPAAVVLRDAQPRIRRAHGSVTVH